MKRMIACCLLLVLALFGCTETKNTQYYMMDTVMSFSITGENAIAAERAIADRVAQLETVFSPTREDSELFRVNENAGSAMEVSRDFANLLALSLKASAETQGAFDVTLGGAVELWAHGKVPASEELEAQVTGSEKISLFENTLQTQKGLKLNFGAVAKGYASDCAKEILEEYEIPRALLSLGGNIYAHGEKEDGTPWNIGVRDPWGEAQDWLGILTARDEFIIASGDYERGFEEDGVRYHHILDPKTRRPATSDLRETVVVSQNGSRGDILSTALFVMGEEKAVAYWKNTRDFEMILVSSDGRVLITPNLKERFTLTKDSYILEVIG
ncbi:MAG: FAD:protein FMN transferase [Ruminococcaceae bacterium]|nr:FAD:protein FMN transferase [Oscillospiraceae bacterium]